MRRHSIGAYLVSSLRDLYYLTGFRGEDSALIVTRGAVHVISDARFEEAINQECPWVTRWLRRGSLNAEIAKVCRRLRIKSLAVQPDHRTLADHAQLKKLHPATRLLKAPPILSRMRRLKDDTEVALLQKAIRVAEESFLAARARVRVGQTELELAARIEYEMKCRGASGPAFGTICAEGSNAALPHAHPGGRKFKRGSAILIDWGARVGGYCSDLTRMLFVGSIPPKLREVYAVVLAAQERALASIRPGQRMCDVDAVARRVIDDAGFGERFSHGLGHGLGLEVHEPPSLSWRSKEELEPGMVITVEPGVYLPGLGGVRIEDDVLVTAHGCRVLSRLDKSLERAVI